MQPIYIQTQTAFDEAVAQLERHPAIALDTEFDNNHYRYGFTLCLLQIATTDACYLIDPYEVSDLSALWKVLENPQIEKIFHDCGEDMRLLRLHDCRPKRIFDTSTAVKLLGYERIGLGSVLSEVLGVTFDKKKQYSNWTLRPLTEAQLLYAAQDVLYLGALREELYKQLNAQNRWEWFEQSMQFLEKKNFSIEPKTTFLSHKEQREYPPFDQYVLNELYRFRDTQAQRVNRPVYQVISDGILNQILHNPAILKNWTTLKGIHHRLLNAPTAAALDRCYREAQATATTMGLSKNLQRAPQAEIALTQERLRRQRYLKEDVFMPIKKQIESQYGLQLTPYILSNEIINTLVGGQQKLPDITSEFQQNIIKEAAYTLQLDISAYC
jgi:ribonuclease D